MTDQVYEKLVDALDRLPNGFPRTPSNVEIPLLKRIFSPEEASLASHLGRHMEPAAAIAERAGVTAEEAGELLVGMAKRGILWFGKNEGALQFRLAPFVVGIYEAQLFQMDEELSALCEEYMENGGAAGIMKPDPQIHRVMPAQGAVNSEWIMPYDDVRKILMASESFSVRDCICRVQRAQLGYTCDHELRVCLSFSAARGAPRTDDISREEALAILDKTEKAGLVHTVSNITDGMGYVCNCCGCCCAFLRGINEWGIEKTLGLANYYAVIDEDTCQGCGTCIERCQVNAISENGDVSVVERAKCIGCGLCVTECPDEAVQLLLKPESEIVHPPKDYGFWEQNRMASRGLTD
jgi:NAD-dependent dihydropyrimidine dehydrogenase PreA subunit